MLKELSIASCDTHTACHRKNTDSGISMIGCYIFTGEIKTEGFMNMKWKFVILAAAICMILSSCITITPAEPENIGEDTALPENAEEDEVMLKNGTYYLQDPETGGVNTPYLNINTKDQTFMTGRGMIFSFALFGSYEADGSVYTLKTEAPDEKTIVLKAISEVELQVVSLEGFVPEQYIFWMQEGEVYAFGDMPPVWYEQVLSADDALALARHKNVPVIEKMQCTSGSEAWDAFYEKVRQGSSASVVIAKYYTLDKEHTAPELYEEEKDEYPMLFFYWVWYNGENFTVVTRLSSEEEDDSQVNYQYLMHYTGKMPATAIYSDYDYYVLVNDASVTWEDIESGMFSSQSDAWIPHCSLYQDCR